MTVESDLKLYIKAFMKAAFKTHAHHYMPVPSGYGKTAVDLIYCLCGRYVVIETKSPPKTPTAGQSRFMEDTIHAGGVAFWCDSEESFIYHMRANGLIDSHLKPIVPPGYDSVILRAEEQLARLQARGRSRRDTSAVSA